MHEFATSEDGRLHEVSARDIVEHCAVPRFVFAALARVRFSADAVHRDG